MTVEEIKQGIEKEGSVRFLQKFYLALRGVSGEDEVAGQLAIGVARILYLHSESVEVVRDRDEVKS